MVKYNFALDDDGYASISIVSQGVVTTITEEHPNFAQIAAAVSAGEDPAEFITIALQITNLDERVSVDNNDTIYFDGEPVHDNLTRTILRYNREGRDSSGLVRFMERLNENPSRRSREQLFDWLQAEDLTIDKDGFFIGYKGISEGMKSMTAGPAVVDGVAVNGHVPNHIGAVVSMDRKLVQDDPNVACSHGLHVGNYSYASNFGQVLVEVKVDPADVVSVPSDSSFQKLRCCQYTVLAVHEVEEDDLSWYEPVAEYDDEAAWDEIDELNIPSTFMQKLRDRFGKK